MFSIYEEYYNQPVFWDKPLYEVLVEKSRIDIIIKSIPEDVSNILEIGCGNGAILNTILNISPKRYHRMVGIGISQEALKHVLTEKYLGTIEKLDFHHNEFDLIILSEVIEHLPISTFIKGLQEVFRVSKNMFLSLFQTLKI